ncbi:CDGSH iron-sulfur domain-containing protein [Halobellus rarus]|uniref:CDGSH iron-sulfur domain-containing protein n=1 Tax=Halobellus rarus TaxID=1126237 RepID=A0ABD6CPY0_9EURY|nr:CDGSH iron-sulfur domain-containing protein [Halobellus rarus]
MGRLVELDATAPLKLDESDLDSEKGDVAVCRCGLSGEFPFCDGTHRKTRAEDGDTLYRYVEVDETVRRRAVDHVAYVADETTDDDSESTTRQE